MAATGDHYHQQVDRHLRHENRLKRGGGQDQVAGAIEELICGEETPELQIVAAENP